MDLQSFLAELKICPLIASVQASEGSPLEDPETLARLAKASASQGVRILRAQGIESISAIKGATGLPVIGLIKKRITGSEVYITPTKSEVDALLDLGCEIVALDATSRARPAGAELKELIRAIHASGRIALGDCDSATSARYAVESGADIVSTTLAGYTGHGPPPTTPELDLVYQMARSVQVPVLAEGRITNSRQAHTALRCGAVGVVVGGALNDPVRQTAKFVKDLCFPGGPVAAFDLGGSWLRFGLFSDDWTLLSCEKIETPASGADSITWIREQVRKSSAVRIGISSGGTIDPSSGIVLQAKSILPDYVESELSNLGLPSLALNDGIATAWGHGCFPEFAGLRVATIAIGTGVGCGVIDQGRILMSSGGATLKLNDLPTSFDRSFEELLGGAGLTKNPSAQQCEDAIQAAIQAMLTVQAMCLPDVIVLCGGVAMADWFDLESIVSKHFSGLNSSEPAQLRATQDDRWERAWVWPKILRSPFGTDAGLFGAAALALFPPVELAHCMSR